MKKLILALLFAHSSILIGMHPQERFNGENIIAFDDSQGHYIHVVRPEVIEFVLEQYENQYQNPNPDQPLHLNYEYRVRCKMYETQEDRELSTRESVYARAKDTFFEILPPEMAEEIVKFRNNSLEPEKTIEALKQKINDPRTIKKIEIIFGLTLKNGATFVPLCRIRMPTSRNADRLHKNFLKQIVAWRHNRGIEPMVNSKINELENIYKKAYRDKRDEIEDYRHQFWYWRVYNSRIAALTTQELENVFIEKTSHRLLALIKEKVLNRYWPKTNLNDPQQLLNHPEIKRRINNMNVEKWVDIREKIEKKQNEFEKDLSTYQSNNNCLSNQESYKISRQEYCNTLRDSLFA